jgi:hypothetical protein
VTSLGEALVLVMYIAAARSDCSPVEAALLRQELQGPLDDYRAGRYGEGDVIDIVNQIMPDGWTPSGEWRNQLEALGFTPGHSG